MSSVSSCAEFRPHHMRPDKCRKCFGDKAKHPAGADGAATSEIRAGFEVELKVNELNREQLIEELKRVYEEKLELKRALGDRDAQIGDCNSQIESLKLELTVSSNSAADGCKECGFNGRQLAKELDEFKSKCRRLEEELEGTRDELRNLEHEMEEMHDNFKEEESEQFEQVKQELDVALKNCKILQIRLNKAERQYNQLEQVKSMLERQLEESASRQPAPASVGSSNPQLPVASQASFVQCGADYVKLSTSEYDQLLRDLNDTIERERDLQEQIKYSQEEAQLKGDRLQAAEAENEVLLGKFNKLMVANSRLRAGGPRGSVGSGSGGEPAGEGQPGSEAMEQNEQLKLALDLAQSECERLRAKLSESHSNLDLKENTIKEVEAKRVRLEEELASARLIRQSLDGKQADSARTGEQVARLELECRQLRSRLIQSERECNQLKAQLELSNSTGKTGERNPARRSTGGAESAGILEAELRQKRDQCDTLLAQNKQLERKVELLSVNQNVGNTTMEGDLLERLKRQLEVSESELAKTRSRLVELNLEYSQIQRKYKRLVESLESTTSIDSQPLARKTRLPPEPMREPMSRQELRQAIRDLEDEIAEWLVVVKSKDCLLKEFRVIHTESANSSNKQTTGDLQEPESGAPTSASGDEQVTSLRRTLEKQHSFIDNLKIDIGNLERENIELQTGNRMLERKSAAMEEELDKLRQVNGELRASLEEARKAQRNTSAKVKELQVNYEKLHAEFAQSRSQQVAAAPIAGKEDHLISSEPTGNSSPGSDLMLLSRDLSELKVKNGFLMRQLEIVREEGQRQLEDLRQAQASQQRRAVELAQLELKERQLAESQLLRDELNELKQKLVISQRQLARSEEEINGERDRIRSLERDWRRENSQWTQRVEQLEAQMSIEKRSSEFKLKEAESQIRDKDRELISLQDKYVQLERDLKRTQNKYGLLEENSESKQKQLIRELESKKRELGDLMSRTQSREDQYYDNCKRFNNEKATLSEALESIKRSYDEKVIEVKSVRELLLLRQEQAFKERSSGQERLDQLSGQLMRMSEFETQAKLSGHQIQLLEKQLDSMKRELIQMKEDRVRLKGRCEELERKCQVYEKRELISKTSSISPTAQQQQHSTTSSLFRSAKSSFQFNLSPSSAKSSPDKTESACKEERSDRDQHQMVEKLSSKINDQRHLINLLKQQHAETQMELKQLKLLQTTERNKWQSRVTQLTSRLNECEEKLLFESSQLIGQEMFESSRKKMEVKWSEERQTTLNLLQQQQAQNEMLMRDLKKLSQTHDLLRLQSKQLESQNNRLSRKLIEYQQAKSNPQPSNDCPANNRELSNKLTDCLAARRQLEAREAQLERLNRKLVKLMEEQTRPLVETVSKIVASIDGSGGELKQSVSVDSAEQPAGPGNQPNSLHRPLFTSASPSELIKTAEPAHVQANQQRSRLSRFLTGASSNKSAEPGEPNSDPKLPAASKTVKKVRVKSSTLGITPGEKKQLKRHLQELSSALGGLAEESKAIEKSACKKEAQLSNLTIARTSNGGGEPRASSLELAERTTTRESSDRQELVNNRTQRGVSYTPTRTTGAGGDSPRVVHWTEPLDQSDLDSERSWSMSQLEQATTTGGPVNSSNSYKRFPQTSPSNYHASLTDYDSETSLASECSTYSMGATHRPAAGAARFSAGGAESDSCMQTGSGISAGSAKAAGGKKKRGLKLRLTSTLRNISRSISGLASDSETSYDNSASNNRKRNNDDHDDDRDQDDDHNGDLPAAGSKKGALREIRV